MPTLNTNLRTRAQQATLLDQLTTSLAPQVRENPAVADEIKRQVQEPFDRLAAADLLEDAGGDGGIADLVGLGRDAVRDLGEVTIPHGVSSYDERIGPQRIQAVADLYYLYQHERIGVFKVAEKLRELFHGGAVRLSEGQGALGLYRYDRKEVLRYTRRERWQAYRRAFGYGAAPLIESAVPNVDFHRLFTGFANHVALFWRDKRVSEVIRRDAADPTYGSVAVVRRAGLDLRNNLKFTAYGHIRVLSAELMQVLRDAFAIFESEDVRNLFGVETGWDVVEEVLVRYFNARLSTSSRQRMAMAGREMLNWLAQDHVLEAGRTEFETKLNLVADHTEEWLTSAQSLGLAGGAARSGATPVAADARAARPRAPVMRRQPPAGWDRRQRWNGG